MGRHGPFLGEPESPESPTNGDHPLVVHGWVCLLCAKVWKTEEEANACAKSHEELVLEPQFELGSDIPYSILARKMAAGKLLWSRSFALERASPDDREEVSSEKDAKD